MPGSGSLPRAGSRNSSRRRNRITPGNGDMAMIHDRKQAVSGRGKVVFAPAYISRPGMTPALPLPLAGIAPFRCASSRLAAGAGHSCASPTRPPGVRVGDTLRESGRVPSEIVTIQRRSIFGGSMAKSQMSRFLHRVFRDFITDPSIPEADRHELLRDLGPEYLEAIIKTLPRRGERKGKLVCLRNSTF